MLAEAIMAASVPVMVGGINKTIKSYGNVSNYIADTSLIDVSKGSRVEPLTIVGGDCLHLAYLPDILQSLSSMFAGYYLQALSYTATVGHVKATNILERLNPDRNYTNASLMGFEAYSEAIKIEQPDWRLAEESYKFRLPTTKNKRAIALEEERVEFGMNSTTRVTIDDKTSYQISKEDFHVGIEAYEAEPSGNAYNSDTDGFSGTKGTGDKHFERVFGRDADHKSTAEINKIKEDNIRNLKNMEAEYDRQQKEKAASLKKRLEEEEKFYDDVHKDRQRTEAEEKEALKEKAAKEKETKIEAQRAEDKDKAEYLEAVKIAQKQVDDQIAAAKEAANRKNNRATVSVSKDAMSQAREMSDLSVGKMVSVQVGGGFDEHGNKLPIIDMHIAFRLMVNSVPETTLQGLLCKGAMDNSMTERYHAWRAGRISFVKDLIFCQDLIDETKKSIMDDKTGVHLEVVARVNNAKKFGLLSKNPSMNVASNLYVISEVTAATIERQLGGKLSSHTVRDKIFSQGYAMIICVIDRQYERITFYHRGINASTNVSLKDIQISNRKSGPDIGDLLKMYTLGSAPHL